MTRPKLSPSTIVAINAAFMLALLLLQGCAATYVTPAAGVSVVELGDHDTDIGELLSVEPASPFPARVAVARVQAPGYRSRTAHGHGRGRYSVVTTRDVETDTDFERLSQLPMVTAVAPLSRLLLPSRQDSLKDLRLASATLRADLLLIYSVESVFHVDGRPLGPLSAISLGMLPNKRASVVSTTTGALIDVRTGFIYGLAEASSHQEQRASIWNEQMVIDAARQRAERESFHGFVGQFERVWKGIVELHAAR